MRVSGASSKPWKATQRIPEGNPPQGGAIIGDRRILRHSYEKSVELLDLSLGLVSMDGITEFCMRHWTGKAAFAAAFRRPLYSILKEVYAMFEWAKDAKRVELPPPVVDEVLCFASLLPFAETDLGSPISPDASPTGGGSLIAHMFKSVSAGRAAVSLLPMLQKVRPLPLLGQVFDGSPCSVRGSGPNFPLRRWRSGPSTTWWKGTPGTSRQTRAPIGWMTCG